MTDALSPRDSVLARIREKLGSKSLATDDAIRQEHASIGRLYQRKGTLAGGGRLQLFIERLEDYDAHVVRTTSEDVLATIDATLADAGIDSVLLPAGFPEGWLPTTAQIVRDAASDGTPLANATLDHMHTVLTTASMGIAETGTLVLEHGAGEGRRALTLIPDRHLCVVRASQVVETVPEAFAGMQRRGTQPLTLISGPSATSDIEMTRIRGVHGPRHLTVILIDGM